MLFYLKQNQLTINDKVQVFMSSEYFDIASLTNECTNLIHSVLNRKSKKKSKKKSKQ